MKTKISIMYTCALILGLAINSAIAIAEDKPPEDKVNLTCTVTFSVKEPTSELIVRLLKSNSDSCEALAGKILIVVDGNDADRIARRLQTLLESPVTPDVTPVIIWKDYKCGPGRECDRTVSTFRGRIERMLSILD